MKRYEDADATADIPVAPGDVLLEIRFTETELIAWDPNGETEIAKVAYVGEDGDGEPFRAAIRALANRIAENRDYVEGGGA